MVNAEVNLRPFEPADQPAADQLLRGIWGADDVTIGYYKFGSDSLEGDRRYLRALVAEQAGGLLGLGSIWTNLMHPFYLYVAVHVHPDCQMRGIGTALYTALMQLRGSYTGYPLQTATWEVCTAALHFLKQRGFEEAKRTYTPTTELAAVDLQRYQRYEAECRAAGYTIASLPELASQPDHPDKLAALIAEIYHATHPGNVPMPLDSPEWKQIVLDLDLVDAGSFVIHKSGDYVALGFLHPHEDPAMLELGWHGVAHGHRQHERAMVLALARREMLYAQQHGYTTIQAEVDTTDPWNMLLLEEVFAARPAAWITLRRPASS